MATEGKFNGSLSMGQGTKEVPLALFALNRKRLAKRLAERKPEKAIVVLQGGDEVPFNDTDVMYNVFRQESYFMWTFGVLEPGCFGALDTKTGKAILFVPRLDPSYAVWMGPLLTLNDYKAKYQVDEVHYVDEIAKILEALKPEVLLTLSGINSDSGLVAKDAKFDGIEKFKVDTEFLFNEIADLRVFKTEMELDVMKYVTRVSSDAHRKVMRMAKRGVGEFQCESTFLDHCYRVGGCRFVSYTCICGSGPNAAVLHYGHAAAPNNRVISQGETCLFDMGANYYGYAADITCSFPENGKFTADQALVYSAVLNANLAVFAACKPGVSWVAMHHLSLRTLLANLKEGGLLRGDVDEMMDAELGLVFQPHGLGHLIGLDVHDVGAYLTGVSSRPTGKNTRSLRFARNLETGMCFTIEPGCYFIDPLLDAALEDPNRSKFLVPDAIARFRGFGGIRIEDDVYLDRTGCVNMTKVPRTIKEIEDWIAGIDDDTKYAN